MEFLLGFFLGLRFLLGFLRGFLLGLGFLLRLELGFLLGLGLGLMFLRELDLVLEFLSGFFGDVGYCCIF